MRAIPGLVPNVSGGYVGANRNAAGAGGGVTLSNPPSVASSLNESTGATGAAPPAAAAHLSDRATLWIGRAHELGMELARCRARRVETNDGDDCDGGGDGDGDGGGDGGGDEGGGGGGGRDGVTMAEEASTTAASAASSSSTSTLGVGLGFKALMSVDELDDLVDIHGDAKPAIFFLSGSSGIAGDTLRYLRMFASLGHLVVCPDDFCGWPKRLRHRQPKRIAPGDPADYWTQNLLYQDEPSTGELVYESCAKQYTSSNRLSMAGNETRPRWMKISHPALL